MRVLVIASAAATASARITTSIVLSSGLTWLTEVYAPWPRRATLSPPASASPGCTMPSSGMMYSDTSLPQPSSAWASATETQASLSA